MEIKSFASGSSGNCYYVSDGKTPLLLEAGIPIREIKRHLNFGLSAIRACLISHEHMDHAKSVLDLMNAGIDCYMSNGTAAAMGEKISRHHRMNFLDPLKYITIGPWSILPFPVQHDAKQPLGFAVFSRTSGERLLYATDTYYVRYVIPGLTHIMIEANHSYEILDRNVAAGVLPLEMKKRLMRSHFSLENVKEFMKVNDLSRVVEIHLIHLSNGNSDEAQFKREIQAVSGKMVFVH